MIRESNASSSSSPSAFRLKSAAFAAGSEIPKKYTCDGPDVSPALEWSEPPAHTASFALIVHDPDAPVGDWLHWTLWNVPGSARGIPEGVAKQAELSNGSRQGKNDFKKIGYNGPCPPGTKIHRYFFRLYALDTKLSLGAGALRKDVEAALQGHTLATAEYMGTYHH